MDASQRDREREYCVSLYDATILCYDMSNEPGAIWQAELSSGWDRRSILGLLFLEYDTIRLVKGLPFPRGTGYGVTQMAYTLHRFIQCCT